MTRLAAARLAALCTLAGPALPLHAQAGSTPSPAQQVQPVLNRLVSAANRLDAAAEAELYWRSHELVSVAQGTPTLGWEARDRKTRQWYGALARQKVQLADIETRTLTSDAVLVMARYRQEIEAKDGRSWKGEGVWTLVLRRVEDEWRVAYEHYSYEE